MVATRRGGGGGARPAIRRPGAPPPDRVQPDRVPPDRVNAPPQPRPLIRAPIHIFTPSAASEAQEREFQQSFILDDVVGWGPERMEDALFAHFGDQFPWRVAVFDEFRYLIKAPSMQWKNSVTRRGHLLMEGNQFPVISWDPVFNSGKRLVSMWLRIWGFNRNLWEFVEFDRLLNPFGAVVLELDQATRNKYDWRFARVRVGACDPTMFTEKHWQLYRDATGYVSSFDLRIEVETDETEDVNAWRARGPSKPPPRREPATRGNPNPLPPPPLPQKGTVQEMDEDLLDDQLNNKEKGASSATGCHENDKSDGHFTDDSDDEHHQLDRKSTRLNPSHAQ